MALSTAVFVGESKNWLPEVIERAKQLKVNGGMEPGAELGPLISPQAKQRVCDLVQTGVDEGAKVRDPLTGNSTPLIPPPSFPILYSLSWTAVTSRLQATKTATLLHQPSLLG